MPSDPEEDAPAGHRSGTVAQDLGIGFWSRDVDAGVAWWDEQMYRIHRRDPALGPPGFDDWINQHVHPDDRAWVAELHRQASARWEPQVDTTFRSADTRSGERWVQSWTRRAWRDGRRIAFGMHLDVTDRERSQALLRRERDRTRFAIEAAELGIWERALDGHITYWNDGMYRLRGFEPSDPRPLDELAALATHPEDHARVWAAVQRHLVNGEPYRYEARVRRTDGSWRLVITQGRAMRDGQGQIIGMAGINLDITERKRADELRLQKERAEQASRDKSAFLARLSHELRTPMNAVLGFTQLLAGDSAEPLTPRQRERLQHVAGAGERLMALIDDLLELAALDAAPPASTEPLPLGEVLQQVQQMLAPQARRREVSLRVEPGCAGVHVSADRRRLTQALAHLGADALRRAPVLGRVRFDARLDGERVQLHIADDGRPCGDDECRRAFEPLSRAGPGGAQGTGMGPSLALQLLAGMGGGAELRAKPAGNLFVVQLPAADGTAPPRAPGATPVVLCIEDNPVNLMLVRELVAMRPALRLVEATNGRAGLDAARMHRPRIVLLDLQLPDIDGFEVLRGLRAEPATADAVCIAISANAMPDQIAAARAAGFDDYWTKPLDVSSFLAGIDRYGASLSRTQPPPPQSSSR